MALHVIDDDLIKAWHVIITFSFCFEHIVYLYDHIYFDFSSSLKEPLWVAYDWLSNLYRYIWVMYLSLFLGCVCIVRG